MSENNTWIIRPTLTEGARRRAKGSIIWHATEATGKSHLEGVEGLVQITMDEAKVLFDADVAREPGTKRTDDFCTFCFVQRVTAPKAEKADDAAPAKAKGGKGKKAAPAADDAPVANPLVEGVKAHAVENFESGQGWDYVVETMSDAEIAEIIGKTQTVPNAIKKVGKHVALLAEREQEIQSA